MKAPQILFWLVVGILVGTMLILVTNQIIQNLLKVEVEYNQTDVPENLCGNGKCDYGEDNVNCPVDCP